jgi:hypothetical protein
VTAQRLPVPGQDDGTWGDVLNGFLEVEHNADGTLKLRTDGSVPLLSSGKVPTANLGSGGASVSNFLRGDGTWAIPNIMTSLANDIDVSISSPSNNQVLTYNSTTSSWQNEQPTAGVDTLGSSSNPMTSASASRPAGLSIVWWLTSIQPTNWLPNDIWIQSQ